MAYNSGTKMPDNETELKTLKKSLNDEYNNKKLKFKKPSIIPWIVNRIFILKWIKNYNKNYAFADLIAGITIGLTIIPQGIAYAALAGLPSQYGLYSAFIGSIVYVFFGTIKEVSIGPTSLMALLILQYTFNKPIEFVIILSFLAGVVELIMGIFKLGFLVDFISTPVTSAFTSATAVIIIGAQAKSLLGVAFPSKGFLDSLISLTQKITQIRFGDSILGLSCIILLLSLRQIGKIKIKTQTQRKRILRKALWYLSISRNAITVFITSIIAYKLTPPFEGIHHPFKLTSDVTPGIPTFKPPPFYINYKNQTLDIVDICKDLGSAIIVAPIVAVLANVAIAKAFASGKKVDASQEMFTLGLCNIIGSFFSSMPTCGAFTRSAVSQASGVKSPMAGIYSGIMVILALSLLTPYFHYIPKATLAAVLICAVIFMIDFKIIIKLWKKNKLDLFSWCGCFLVSLLIGVQIGLLVGVLINLAFLLYKWARPCILVSIREMNNMQYISIVPLLGLLFPMIDYLKEKIITACTDTNFNIPVVIDCSRISSIDYTSTINILQLSKELKEKNTNLILQYISPNLQQQFQQKNYEISFSDCDQTLNELLLQNHILNHSFILREQDILKGNCKT